jgi:hypothetical protein
MCAFVPEDPILIPHSLVAEILSGVDAVSGSKVPSRVGA